jgi:hypothetical protein
MRKHEISAVGESKRVRDQIGRAQSDSDRQREFWRTFQWAGIGADKRRQWHRDDGHRQATMACAFCDQDNASQVMVQGATLIVRISGAMLVLSAVVMSVMMVHMIDFAARTEIDSNILLILEGMLDMDGD